MSGTLVIAAVTALLKNLLENALIQQAVTTGLGDVVVSALPPDRVPIGTEERLQVNLYLYRLTPNSGWRRADLSEAKQQEQLPALDLHYLLTAYSERDFQAEILLGAAVHALQRASCLTHAEIVAGLRALSIAKSENAMLRSLVSSTELESLDQLRIVSEFLSLEDLSKLWSSLQARSRISATYQVSVVSSAQQRRIEAANTRSAWATR